MNISRADLAWAVEKGIVSSEQAEALWGAIEQRRAGLSRFDVPNVAYYLGALIVMSAMGWFMTQAWERFGGGGILLISMIYGVCFALAGYTLWRDGTHRIPGGLLVTMAVWMVPLAVYGLERLTGVWPQGYPGAYQGYHFWVKGSWFLMESATILAGLVALRFVPFPFLTFPIAFSFWYMSMDLTPLLFGKTSFSWEDHLWVSLCAGLLMLIVSFVLDRRTKEDFASWGYLFGMLAFWGGLVVLTRSEVSRTLYAAVNFVLMFVSILLQRRVFIVFGAVGVFFYLGHLAYDVFKNSVMFPFALTLLGLGVIYLGVQYQRHHERVEARIRSALLGR